ncbi:MAG: potassium channel family protein, partial [Acidimicrobiales bacterium]
MRVVIAGAGNVGVFIAEDLLRAKHTIRVIEQDPEVVSRLETTLGVGWVVGDACEVGTLQAAELESADVIVAATGDDEDNLVVSLLAKQEFAVPRVVARVNHPKN